MARSSHGKRDDPGMHLHGSIVGQSALISELRTQGLHERRDKEETRSAERDRGHCVKRGENSRVSRVIFAHAPIDARPTVRCHSGSRLWSNSSGPAAAVDVVVAADEQSDYCLCRHVGGGDDVDGGGCRPVLAVSRYSYAQACRVR